MSDPLIRECDHYLILEPYQSEKLLSSEETLDWLQEWLEKLEALPEDLVSEKNIEGAAKKLLDTACDLEVKPGYRLQWFAVRLEAPNH